MYIDRYGYLYISSIRCARSVLPVCEAPVISITIYVKLFFNLSDQ